MAGGRGEEETPLVDDGVAEAAPLGALLREEGLAEAGRMWAIAWPVAVSNLARQCMTMTDIAVVGHLGVSQLAAASTAGIYMNITLFPVFRAIAPAGVSLMSAAYGKAAAAGEDGDPQLRHQVGVYFQTTLLSAVLYVAMTAGAWMATEDVMLATGVNATTSHLGGQFAELAACWLPPCAVMACLSALLQSLHVVLPQMVVYVLCAALNLLLNMYFVHGFGGAAPGEGMGFLGSPTATAVSRGLQAAVMCAVVVWWRRDHAPYWGGWNPRGAARQLGQFWKLACPLALGALFEESQLEVVSVFAARLGQADIAAQNGVLQLFFFLTSAMYGVMTACETRMSHCFGAGRPGHARLVGGIAGILSVAIGLVVGATFVVARHDLGYVFSQDEEVVSLTAAVCSYVGPSYFLISLFYTSAATLTAQQRTGGLAVAYLVGPWCVGVPLAYALAFTYGQGIEGLWKGLIVGYATCTLVLLILCARSDWVGIAREVRAKLEVPHEGSGSSAASGVLTPRTV